MDFTQLGLAEPLLRATNALGYKTVTPIQAEAIPTVLAGRDLVGCAQTGTGKTAAFALPMLDKLLRSRPSREDSRSQADRPRRGPKGANPGARPLRALILAPTRELAAQISDSIQQYGRFTSLRQCVVFGGVSQQPQVKALRHGVDVLTATPGRLLDLMEQGYIDLSTIEILILDEADQMLDMGFLPALKRIVAAVPARRQTLMFSATMPDEIRQLAQQWLSNPAAIAVGPVAAPVDRVTQSVYLVDKKRKHDLLARFLKETPRSRTLVFSRTKHGADKIVQRLAKDGVRAAAIHGNKSQSQRTRTIALFKGESPPVLVATDIAARGLDIENVSHVVNFDLPHTPEIYVHRIGRTARAGAEGVAVSFCAGDERGLLRQIERLTRRSIAVESVIVGFEPTDPISAGDNGEGNQGAAKRRPGGRPRRQGAGAASAGPQSGPPRRRKDARGATAQRNKTKRPGGGTPTGPPRKRRRQRLATS
jgi:ATP-dependent RNA helicase RhlE